MPVTVLIPIQSMNAIASNAKRIMQIRKHALSMVDVKMPSCGFLIEQTHFYQQTFFSVDVVSSGLS